jgi:N utilization substance protein A
VDEIRGEKVDIVPWDEDPSAYLAKALSPARIARIVLHPDAGIPSAEVIVPNDQLSLAIGKKGQNARLAARLTGIKIDIKNEEQHAQEERARMDAHFQEVSQETAEEIAQAKVEAPSAEAAGMTREEKSTAPPDEIDEGSVEAETPPVALELARGSDGLPLIPPSPEVPNPLDSGIETEGN